MNLQSLGREYIQARSWLFVEKGVELGEEDTILKWSVILVTFFGLVTVYSASFQVYGFSIFFKQCVAAVVGLAAMYLGQKVNPQVWKNLAKSSIGIALLLMLVLHLTPLGSEVLGSRRWLGCHKMHFFQPSDVVRVSLILLLAKYISDYPEMLAKPDRRLLYLVGVVVLMTGLIFIEPDLSTTLLTLMVVGLMLFLGGINLKYIIPPSIIGIGVIALFLREYQLQRLLDFVLRLFNKGSGEWHPHMKQAFIALTRGGFYGIGFAQGDQARRFLPYPFSDFIYPLIGEEFGFLGTGLVLLFFFFLFFRCLKIAKAQPDRYGFMLGMGLLGSIMIYALINMGITVGLGPVTGLPLPFLSQGGTALVISLWSIGVLLRLSRRMV